MQFWYLAQSNRFTPLRGVFITGSVLYITAISQNSSSLCSFHLLFLTGQYTFHSQLYFQQRNLLFLASRLLDISCFFAYDACKRLCGSLFSCLIQFEMTLDNSGLGHSHRAYLNILFTLYRSVLGPGRRNIIFYQN